MSKFYYIVGVVLALFSCSSQEMDKKGLEAYLLDDANGLKQSVEVGPMKLELIYRPTELVWYKELEKLDKKRRDSLLMSMQNRRYFTAIYSTPKEQSLDPLSQLAGNKKAYKEVLSTLSFRFGENTTLVLEGNEEINASQGFFSKSYGMSASNSVLFFFNDNTIEKLNELKIKINDVGFGIGQQYFSFQKEEIEQLPKLKL